MRCPLSYESLRGRAPYSLRGLRALDPRLRRLAPLGFTSPELRAEARDRADKMSIGGVQPKLSAVLHIGSTGEGAFEVVDSGGEYILKPATEYPEVPANEDVTMRMAATASVETPWHGLVRTRDDDLCYVIRRFDRLSTGAKLAVEDAGQLLGLPREGKYDASMERLARALLGSATLPAAEALALWRLVLVVYLTGNEDAHLRNFSLLTDVSGRIRLTPANDLLNYTIVLSSPTEELALTLAGKKSGISRANLHAFAADRLALAPAASRRVLDAVAAVQPTWDDLLARSFLSESMKARYAAVLERRRAVLFS